MRSPRFELPDDLADVFDGELSAACSRVAFSLTLPYLEPYLIRVYRSILPLVRDPRLRADVEAFCGQEAQHHRAHASMNRVIRRRLGPTTSERLVDVEDRLAADYQRFTTERSLRFNAAYAEGFEAMTCAMGMTGLESGNRPNGNGPWNQLWTWHLAEELEHRTVAFEVFEHLSGDHRYRVVIGFRAQAHFLRAMDQLHRILMRHHGRRVVGPHLPPLLRQGWRRYLATFRRDYHPADIEPPASIERVLERFDAGT